MKHLITLAALLVSTAAVAQIPTLPWNPDENGDQFVGLPDLLGLLTVYGQEFQNAIVAEDGESAIMYMGDMAYPLCAQACENLPGIWQLPEIEDLGLVWAEVNSEGFSWLTPNSSEEHGANNYVQSLRFYENGIIRATAGPNADWRCYCAAKQLPRVEYTACVGCNTSGTGTYTVQNLQSCIDDKLAEGWYPLGNPVQTGYNGSCTNQAFWRFAQ